MLKKIGRKRTEYFIQGRGVRQGCNLSPTLFNFYINELTKENSPIPRHLDQKYKTPKLSFFFMLMTLSCRHPQKRDYRIICCNWKNTAKPGTYQSTNPKPKYSLFKKLPNYKETIAILQLEVSLLKKQITIHI